MARSDGALLSHLRVGASWEGFVIEQMLPVHGHSGASRTGRGVAGMKRLVVEGAIEKLSRPLRYRSTASIGALFDHASRLHFPGGGESESC